MVVTYDIRVDLGPLPHGCLEVVFVQMMTSWNCLWWLSRAEIVCVTSA